MEQIKQLWNDIKPNISSKVSKETIPSYYQTVLLYSHCLMMLYFVCYIIFSVYFSYYRAALYAVPVLALTAMMVSRIHSMPDYMNLPICISLTILWVILFVHIYGWDCGGQHFLVPVLIIGFFSVNHSLAQKILYLCILFTLRMNLFFYCLHHVPAYILPTGPSSILQVINTAFVFANIAVICIFFSTNIQKADKQLLIHNQELKHQADTDPLTALPNRRYMMALLEKRIENYPLEGFSVALGDIDLFKNVNDTYGHNCGDAVLKQLARLFEKNMAGKGYVCRWGGEEFFFFIPDANIDTAASWMVDLKSEISRTPITYKDVTLHVTMTFGVEEYDYRSGLTDLIKNADDKLYLGKKQGRNKVIF